MDDITGVIDLSNPRCEICHERGLFGPFQGHVLCAECTLLGCGTCWKARMDREERWLWWRWKCPKCNERSRWHAAWRS